MAMSFSLQIKDFVKTVKVREEVVVRKLAFGLLEGVVKMSPVGNPELWKRPVKGYVGGRFRANWQVGINAPVVGTLETKDKSGSATLAKGRQVLSGVKAGGGIIYITNNLPQAVPLEFGHSKQAPVGMVRVTVARYQAMLDKAVAEAKQDVK